MRTLFVRSNSERSRLDRRDLLSGALYDFKVTLKVPFIVSVGCMLQQHTCKILGISLMRKTSPK